MVAVVVAFAAVVVGFSAYVVLRDPGTTVAAPRVEPSRTPSPTPSSSAVPKTVEVDFSGSGIPDGFATFDDGTTSDMTVEGGRLVHGESTGGRGASYLETELPGDVQRIGAVVEFADSPTPGAVALIAWEDSLVQSRTVRNTLPRSGLHFVAFPGQWHVGIIDPDAAELETIIGSGKFPRAKGPQEFDVVRDGDTVRVTDPSGTVTKVTDPRIAEYAGPWANWELYELDGDFAPASFLRVWAG